MKPDFNVQRSTFNAQRAALMLLVCALSSVAVTARAQGGATLQHANRIDCSTLGTNLSGLNKRPYYTTGTNNWVAFSNKASVVYTVELSNFSASDVYLLVFDMGTNAVAGDAPWAAPVKVAAGTTGGKNWAPNGAPFQSLCVAASTTPNSLTNAAAGTGVFTVTRNQQP